MESKTTALHETKAIASVEQVRSDVNFAADIQFFVDEIAKFRLCGWL